MIKDAIANNARRRSPSHNRTFKMPVFAQAVRECTVSVRKSISLKKWLGIVDVNVLYHTLPEQATRL
jgi:hypothetical protein